MRLIFTIAIIFSMSIGATAQSGWELGKHYKVRGSSEPVFGNIYTIVAHDSLGNTWEEGWQECGVRNWYQEPWSGYIYYWSIGNMRHGPGWTASFYTGEELWWHFKWYYYKVKVWSHE